MKIVPKAQRRGRPSARALEPRAAVAARGLVWGRAAEAAREFIRSAAKPREHRTGPQMS